MNVQEKEGIIFEDVMEDKENFHVDIILEIKEDNQEIELDGNCFV